VSVRASRCSNFGRLGQLHSAGGFLARVVFVCEGHLQAVFLGPHPEVDDAQTHAVGPVVGVGPHAVLDSAPEPQGQGCALEFDLGFAGERGQGSPTGGGSWGMRMPPWIVGANTIAAPRAETPADTWTVTRWSAAGPPAVAPGRLDRLGRAVGLPAASSLRARPRWGITRSGEYG
jgi:hypothetical protein